MMTLRSGKFYKDGVQVPVEFGNLEQIKLLKKVEELRSEGDDVHYNLDSDGDGSVWYNCVCGHIVPFEYDYDDMDGVKSNCSCGLCYYIKADDENYLTVFLKK